MKFKEALKDTNKNLIQFIKHDHWELKQALVFYKQAFRDFAYATFILCRWFLALVGFLFIPVLYPVAILIRVMRDE